MNDTIFAPSSAIGGAIAVIRISGEEVRRVSALLERDVFQTPRLMTHTRLMDGDEAVDDCMAVFFAVPNTYTGEDMVELNCHGGVETVRRILELLGGLGFRPAQGGEFTRRAFLNGKMDLTQAEAVMDIINATAEQSRKAAMLQLQGSVSREIHETEQLLLDALSGIDAAIDYPFEAEADAYAHLPDALGQAIDRVDSLIRRGLRGRVLREGLRVAILGRPNVGKSSLMNALLGSERAIVTANAGTTRDVLDEQTAFSGVPVRLMDTAGLRETEDEAERIGVDRARATMGQADVLCLVLDGSAAVTGADKALLRETEGTRRVILLNKSDLPEGAAWNGPDALRVSARTGQGLDALRQRILELAAPGDGECGCITNQRHIRALTETLTDLRAATETRELDCAATDIRNALHELGTITGTDVDGEVIDRIFANFCVGK